MFTSLFFWRNWLGGPAFPCPAPATVQTSWAGVYILVWKPYSSPSLFLLVEKWFNVPSFYDKPILYSLIKSPDKTSLNMGKRLFWNSLRNLLPILKHTKHWNFQNFYQVIVHYSIICFSRTINYPTMMNLLYIRIHRAGTKKIYFPLESPILSFQKKSVRCTKEQTLIWIGYTDAGRYTRNWIIPNMYDDC